MGLVSRYNLPPAPNPDDSYPVPDANNPFADPQLSVRQSAVRGARLQLRRGGAVRGAEGGVVLKYLYNRPSPGRSTAASRR